MIRAVLSALLALSFSAPAMAQSLEQMAGQMIIVGFKGDDVGDASVKAVRDEIAAGTLGGVMYLKPNVKTLAAVKAMNAAFRAASPDLPPFLTLDQEGGAVERLTSAVGFQELPNAETIAAKDSPAEAEATYADLAKAIANEGFTVNFGPVADLNINPDNQIIAKYGRSFGKSGKTVAAYDQAFIQAHHDAGLLTALKHFPGHGSSTADSHAGFVDISKTWSPSELDPYKALFAGGYDDFVMVGHLYHKDYAGSGAVKLPASLSPEWIEGVLRGQLKFAGVVISDDLEMGAIRKQFDLHDTVVGAVNAGVDVLLFSNTAAYSPDLADKVRGILVAEANADPTFRAKIEASYARIVAMKARIGS
ncbi:MAG TPA: glycoside hydrolase family 3 N-terminal domain-containing protein [Devosia sp.]|nr:glycoside hydrolase family 3 N-terminal domain-containing protein [Devosia sp.]